MIPRTTPHRRPPRTSDSVWQNDLGVIELGREKGRPQCDAHERTLEEDGERVVLDAAMPINVSTLRLGVKIHGAGLVLRLRYANNHVNDT